MARGLNRTDDHWYSYADGPSYPGITSALNEVSKGGLPYWSANETARAAVGNYERLGEMIATDGPRVAEGWLAAKHVQARDDAAAFGREIHKIAERIEHDSEWTVDTATLPYVAAYRAFLDDFAPTFVSRERYVLNETVGYGATYDFVARMPDVSGRRVLTLGDVKTGKAIYVETRLQLVAIARAEFAGVPGVNRKWPIPKIQQLVVVHIRPEAYSRGYQVYRIDPTEADWRAVQAAVALKHWRTSKPAAGTALEIPERKVAA
jgi:hypothetical protein